MSTLFLLFDVDGCIDPIGNDDGLDAVSLELAREWNVDTLNIIGTPDFLSFTVLFQFRVRSHLVESQEPVACHPAVPLKVKMVFLLRSMLF